MSSRVIMRVLYKSSKERGCPKDETLEKRTQSLKNIGLTTFMCQGTKLIIEKEHF